jgi:hypothetical protein
MTAVTHRRATAETAQLGAVLWLDDRLWDVVDVHSSGTIRLRSEDGCWRNVQRLFVGRYVLARAAPSLDDLRSLPGLDGETDGLRRSGIFANLDGAA